MRGEDRATAQLRPVVPLLRGGGDVGSRSGLARVRRSNVGCPLGCLSVGNTLRPRYSQGKAAERRSALGAADAVETERPASRVPGSLGSVPTPDEEAGEPLERLVGRHSGEAHGSSLGQVVGAIGVAGTVEIVEDGAGDGGSDALGREGARDRSPAGFPTLERVLGEGARERFVVDEADPFEALELVGDLVVVEPRGRESALELAPAAWPDGEQPERPLVDVLAEGLSRARAHADDEALARFVAGSSSSTTSGTISIG